MAKKKRDPKREAEQKLIFFEQILRQHRLEGNRTGEADALRSLGHAYLELERPQMGLQAHRESLAIYTQLGDLRNQGIGLANVATAYIGLGGDCSGWRLKPRLRQRSPPSRTQPA